MTADKSVNITPEMMMQATNNFGIAQLLGMKIKAAEPGIGRVRIQVDKRLMHPQHTVHGGVIFTLADTATSMAILSVVPEGTRFSTVEAKINFLLPVRAGELLAEGKFVHQGRATAVLEPTVYNIHESESQAIARILSTFNIACSKAHHQHDGATQAKEEHS